MFGKTIKRKSQDIVFRHAYGFLKSASRGEHREDLMAALMEAYAVAEGVAEATGDTDAAVEAGIYEFELLRAVAEAKNDI